MLLPSEPLWALAFCWLPLFESADERQLIKAAVRACPITPPQTVAEFSLWVEAYGTGRARGQLEARMSVFKEMDARLVVRVASMVRSLPRRDRVSTAKRFCHLWTDLPTVKFRESLVNESGFDLLTSLLADYGGWLDREKQDSSRSEPSWTSGSLNRNLFRRIGSSRISVSPTEPSARSGAAFRWTSPGIWCQELISIRSRIATTNVLR